MKGNEKYEISFNLTLRGKVVITKVPPPLPPPGPVASISLEIDPPGPRGEIDQEIRDGVNRIWDALMGCEYD